MVWTIKAIIDSTNPAKMHYIVYIPFCICNCGVLYICSVEQDLNYNKYLQSQPGVLKIWTELFFFKERTADDS